MNETTTEKIAKKPSVAGRPAKKPVTLQEHIVEIISDSGEGAQRCGQSLGGIAARMGYGIWTVEIIPAEIRPPARSVAGASGILLNWKSAEEYCDHFYTQLVPPTAKHFPSMYYDVKAGKKLEIDALNGAMVMLAREKGMHVPINETVTLLIKAKEAMTQRL